MQLCCKAVAIWLIGAGATLLLSSCTPRISGGFRGQVIDADTKQPIQGAAIRLEGTVHCFALVQQNSYDLRPVETRSDEEGRFNVSRGLILYPCIAAGWTNSLSILAPGYFPELWTHSGPMSVARHDVRIELERLRYAVEHDHYVRAHKDEIRDWLVGDEGDSGPVWRETVAATRSMAFRSLGPSGVFAMEAGASFDQILPVGRLRDILARGSLRRVVILARDRKTGTVYGWTTKGNRISVPLAPQTGWSLLGANRFLGYPFLLLNERIYYPQTIKDAGARENITWQDWAAVQPLVGRVRAAVFLGDLRTDWVITVEADGREFGIYRVEERSGEQGVRISVTPSARRQVSQVIPGGQPPIECMTNGPDPDSLIIVAHTVGGRAIFLVQGMTPAKEAADAWRIETPAGILASEVTACALGNGHTAAYLYLAMKEKGIRRLSFGWEDDPHGRYPKRALRETSFWENSKAVVLDDLGRPRNFTGLAVAELERVRPVVYGVAGDGRVYRFTRDGVPDQRIELELPQSPTRP